MTAIVVGAGYNAAMASIGFGWRSLRASSPFIFDLVLAVILAVLAVAEGGAQFVPVELLATLPLAWRHHWPLPVFCLVFLGALGAATPAPWVVICSAMLAAYSVGAYSRHRVDSFLVILATATFILVRYGGSLPALPDFAGPYVLLVPMWLAGNAIRNWQLRVAALQDRAALVKQDQERATRTALIEERARIARELHDVVAHGVSVMVVQAGAARQVMRTEPDRANESLLAVEGAGREALTELRAMLGLLHDDGGDVSLTPQPGLDQLNSLVQRVEDAGLPVDLHIVGTRRPLPVAVDLTAYRIVQEALTNALKYSGLAPTEVVLDYREDELKVEVLDDGAGRRTVTGGPGQSGRGLAGMKERVSLYGGVLEAGPRLERGYAVRAWLPTGE